MENNRASSPEVLKHVPSLDGFRGFAVLLVITFHFLSRKGTGPLGIIASVGWSGVDAFLVLSGYLITGILYRQRGSPNFFRDFYARRALRLFPLYYFVLILLLVLTPPLHIRWRPGQIPFFFYGANFSLSMDQTLGFVGPFRLQHLWTLALEEQFYLIWPWVVGSRLSRKQLVRISLGGIFFAFLLRIFLVLLQVRPFLLYESLPTRMDALLVGAVIALTPLPSMRRASLLLGVGAIAFFVALRLAHNSFFLSRPMAIAGYSGLALVYGAILILSLHASSPLSVLFSSRLLRFYGRISYGVYLWHYLLALYSEKLSMWIGSLLPQPTLASSLSFALTLFATTVIAHFSYVFLERPFLRLKRHFAPSSQQRSSRSANA